MNRREILAGGISTAAMLSMPRLARAQRANELHFVPLNVPPILDPFFAGSVSVAHDHAYSVFDTLYGVNSKLEPLPQMAEGHEVSGDNKVWTIKLRDGLKFHDGEPVRGVDCVASMQRWMARDALGKTVATYLDSLTAVDDRSFRITMKQSFPSMLQVLGKPTNGPLFIVPERLGKEDPTKPISELIGSGPYKWVTGEYQQGSRHVYEKFTDYVPRQEAPDWLSGGKVANFDRVVWHAIPDQATALAGLQNGEIDWLANVPPDLAELAGADANLRLRDMTAGGSLGYMILNHLHAPFNNLKVRQALLKGISQDDFMLALLGTKDRYATCKSFYPCGTPYGQEVGASFYKGNLEEAQAALKESGYNGEKVTLLSPTGIPLITPLGFVAADYLGKIGINVELVELDFGSYAQRRNNTRPPDEGGWSAWCTTFIGGTVLNPMVNPLTRGQGEKGFSGYYESAEMEKKATDWLFAATDADRLAIADAMQKEMFEQAVHIPLGQAFAQSAYRADIADIITAPYFPSWGVRRAA